MTDLTIVGFAGINNTVPAERVKSMPDKSSALVDLTDAVNVDLDNSGRLARRDGQQMKVAGAAHSLWADGDDCLFVAGNSLKRLHPDFSSEILATGLTAGLLACYVAVNGRIYWSNGQQTGVIDGVNRSWGMPLVEVQPQLAAIGGTLGAGQYQVAMTYLRNDGQESGTGLVERIDLTDNSGIRFAWPIPADPTIAEVGLYVSEPNGMTLYQALVVPVGAGSADFIGGLLSLPLNTQWLDAPPAGQCLAYHRGRILVAKGEYVFASNALGYEYFDLRDYLALDGSTVRFIAGVEHGLYIGTEKKVYFASGDRLEEMGLKVVTDAPGVAGSAVIADGFAVTGNQQFAEQQVALFATGAGIYVGLEDGTVLNLSFDRYRFTATAHGAAVFRLSDTLNQYLLFMQN